MCGHIIKKKGDSTIMAPHVPATNTNTPGPIEDEASLRQALLVTSPMSTDYGSLSPTTVVERGPPRTDSRRSLLQLLVWVALAGGIMLGLYYKV